MGKIGMGHTLGELKHNIDQLKTEIKNLNNQQNLPELINSTNLIRQNEHLKKIDEKKSTLISTYDDYSKELEKMISTIFQIQTELKEILKIQSRLLKSKSKTPQKKKPKRKSKNLKRKSRKK